MSSPTKYTLEEKIDFIREESKNVIVLTGPTGSGKGLIINFLTTNYKIRDLPFITTRNLRDGEAESGSKQVKTLEFLMMEYSGKLFLSVSNYGNLYGYDLDIVYAALKNDEIIILEAPPGRIITEVDTLLPQSTKLAVIPPNNFSKETLKVRNTESDSTQTLRHLLGEAEIEELRFACAHSKVFPILPTLGEPEWSLKQVKRIIDLEFKENISSKDSSNNITEINA